MNYIENKQRTNVNSHQLQACVTISTTDYLLKVRGILDNIKPQVSLDFNGFNFCNLKPTCGSFYVTLSASIFKCMK
jgi:hypothetical protein